MIVVRVLLQTIMVVMFLLAFSQAFTEPMTAVHVGNMIGVLLFFIVLFVATFSIGEKKEKQWANVLGYATNPKTLGVMLIALGAFMVLASWRIFSGQALEETPQVHTRGVGTIVDVLFQVPVLLLPAGLALGWYGVKMFRARQPNSALERTRKKPRAAQRGR